MTIPIYCEHKEICDEFMNVGRDDDHECPNKILINPVPKYIRPGNPCINSFYIYTVTEYFTYGICSLQLDYG